VLVYARRALPVPAVTAVLLAMACWFWLLNSWPSYLWLAGGIAAGLLGAGAARLFDEPAAAVVDTLPRALCWRTVARSIAATALVVVWLVGVWTVDTDQPGVHLGLLRLHGVGAVLTVAATCTGLRRRGHATPGFAVGSTLFLVLLYLATSNPLPHHVPLFPLVTDPVVVNSTRLWWGIVITAAGALVAFCCGQYRPPRRPPLSDGSPFRRPRELARR
jgi:hypothetical protein